MIRTMESRSTDRLSISLIGSKAFALRGSNHAQRRLDDGHTWDS